MCIFLLIFISTRLRSSTTPSSSFGPSGWAVESSANSIIDDYLTKKYWTFSIIFVSFSILTCVIPISYNLIQDGYKYRLVTPENPYLKRKTMSPSFSFLATSKFEEKRPKNWQNLDWPHLMWQNCQKQTLWAKGGKWMSNVCLSCWEALSHRLR